MRLLQVTCAVGLIVQVVMLVFQFAQYKTVVNVDLQSGEYDILPALTVCLPIYISVRKVADKYSNVSEIIEAHQQYKNAIANITQLSNDAQFRNQTNSLYLDKFVAFVERQNLTVDELFKLTVPYEQNNTKEGILFKVGTMGSKIAENGSTKFETEFDKEPIASVMLGHDYLKTKCFTFFSQLNKKYHDFKSHPDGIGIWVSSMQATLLRGGGVF